MSDAGDIIEGKGGHDYLVRSIAIVTLLYESGILQELLESGRLAEEEIDTRADIIRRRYPEFANPPGEDAAQEPDAIEGIDE